MTVETTKEDEIAALHRRLRELGEPVAVSTANLSAQVPRSLKASLERHAKDMNRSVSDLVRLALQEWVGKQA